MKRLVGIDYGRRRIGLAVTDPLGITVQGRPTIRVSGAADAVSRVLAFLDEEAAARVVVGLPLNMDGSRGEMALEAERFGARLRDGSGLDVVYWDERLTSEQAKRALGEGRSERQMRGQVDRVAAALMLESYLRAHPIA